ncbi:MAG: calcium/proton exchanger [Chloroflexota bacterium]
MMPACPNHSLGAAMTTERRPLNFTSEDRVMGVVLLALPATLVAARQGWSPTLQFFLSVVSVIPLAAFIGSATEALADRLGGRIGGLLNATFGNAPDVLVGVFGVQKGLIPLVKATLIGALISNTALVMGLCCIVAGLKYGRPRFDREEAGHHSVLMMLTVAAILFPSLGALALCGNTQCHSASSTATLLHVSVGISLALLAAYVAYVAYAIFGLESLTGAQAEGRQAQRLEQQVEQPGSSWPPWFASLVLALATTALIPITDILTGSVEPVTHVLGWTTVFVGIIVVANAGNVAEAYAAIRLAFQRGGDDPAKGDSGMDLSLGIASASSIQIATFVAPVVVLYSLTAHNMNLVFSPVEIGILALLALIFAYIAHDGETNWLEGVHLLTLYVMAAVVFFALPVSAFGG